MQPGDWVRCISIRSPYCGWTGYVEWVRPPECKVVLTLDDYDHPARREIRMLMRDFAVDNEPFLTDEHIVELIDQALDTRDEEWFRELARRKGGERIGEMQRLWKRNQVDQDTGRQIHAGGRRGHNNSDFEG